jgi:hypothetical protein
MDGKEDRSISWIKIFVQFRRRCERKEAETISHSMKLFSYTGGLEFVAFDKKPYGRGSS